MGVSIIKMILHHVHRREMMLLLCRMGSRSNQCVTSGGSGLSNSATWEAITLFITKSGLGRMWSRHRRHAKQLCFWRSFFFSMVVSFWSWRTLTVTWFSRCTFEKEKKGFTLTRCNSAKASSATKFVELGFYCRDDIVYDSSIDSKLKRNKTNWESYKKKVGEQFTTSKKLWKAYKWNFELERVSKATLRQLTLSEYDWTREVT